MRQAIVLALCIASGTLAGGAADAQVIRCVDTAGGVSYTDQKCPPNTRSAEQVMGPEATDPRLAPAEPPQSRRNAPSSAAVPAPAAQTPAAPPAADRFAEERAEAQRRELERQRRLAEYADDNAGYPYPYPYPNGRYGPPASPQDMRPQLRSCDAGGCNDTLGNRYNPNGKLQSYQGLNGQKCQPVGTTVVCR
jgi:hypothetical protein